MHGETAGYRHTLLLTSGEVFGHRISLLCHSYLAEHLHGFFLRIFLGESQQLDGCKGDVLKDGKVLEEVEVLEHHTHTLTQFVEGIFLP